MLDWPEHDDFREVLDRYTAAKELGIAPVANYDEAPARLIECLLTFSRELQAAQKRKAAQERPKGHGSTARLFN